MKIQPYVDKLNSSGEFKNFQKEHNDAFMVAGFFILDLEEGKNLHQIDYYIPSKKKIAAFTLDSKITMQILDLLNTKIPEKLDIKTKVDLDQIKGILEEEMKNRNITDEIKKIIAVLQNIEGKKIWNLNCILSGMGILTAHVEDSSKSVLKMEKKSLLDIMKKVPAGALRQQMDKQQAQKMPVQESDEEGMSQMQMPINLQPNPDELKNKIKKLEELEQEIEKEKDQLEKEISEKETKNKADKINKDLAKALKTVKNEAKQTQSPAKNKPHSKDRKKKG